MKDASLIVRYESSKYYVRNYVTTNTLLRIVALNVLMRYVAHYVLSHTT